MRRIVVRKLVVGAALAVLTVTTPAAADGKLDKVFHLLEVNGARQGILTLTNQLLQSPDSPFNKPDPRLSEDMRKAIRDGFVEELQANWSAVLLEIAVALEGALSEDDVDAAIAFFSTPSGTHYAQALNGPQQQQQIGQAVKAFLTSPQFMQRVMTRAFAKLKYQPGGQLPAPN
ncbi:MAG TPA: hypothetical protein VL974_15165 [Magnetospirillum sp.]|jgi:hypothetical protein|nr:hypothetical protein [Magnetospirillum sp.]